ncbi:MAG: caspase family protein [Bacteroidaceae bacterium]|nr:caspase family protein [Bacteroidaceae bacterium]
MKLKILLFVSLLSMVGGVCAQSIEDARAQYNEFVNLWSSGEQGVNAYNVLYQCHGECYALLDASSKGSDEWVESKNLLVKIMPFVRNAVYFYFERNNKQRACEFSAAYIDVIIHESLRGDESLLQEDYGKFSWLAAMGACNSKDFAKAIEYLSVYINSDDIENKAKAYYYMAMCYDNIDDSQYARHVLEQGLTLFPDDMQMLTRIINILEKTIGKSEEDDALLQRYVAKALQFRPNDENLLSVQGQLYELAGMYEQSIGVYARLKEIKPQIPEFSRHLAENNYNAAVVCVHKLQELQSLDGRKDKKEIKRLNELAGSYFAEAAGLFNQLMLKDGWNIKYAYPIAYAYSYLGDDDNLARVNGRIKESGYKAIVDHGGMEIVDFDKSVARAKFVHKPVHEKKPVKPQPVIAQAPKPVMSDVDIDIPVNDPTNVNTFVTIIANEKYNEVAHVPNAENDGRIFAEYCNKVLGIPRSNISTHFNVTYGQMLDAIEDIKEVARIVRENSDSCNVIVYYAGHGVPDEETKDAYILPVDATGKQMRVCYPLSELYRELGSVGADCTTVFLDACFSGATRKDREMLISARSIAIDVDESEVNGKLVIFSAATGDQTALSYDEKSHGMFTYYLLKKLKESNGDVTLAELGKYITDNVELQARLKNHKKQTPTVVPGTGFSDDWQMLRLR